jgi:transposase
MSIFVLGIDLGKNVCSLVGLDEAGAVVLRRRLRRDSVAGFIGKLPTCIVAMEACCGAHHLGRVLGGVGHTIRLMSPEYVRPYVKANKNDDRDAEAIAEAATRPTMRFVPVKSEAQSDIQALHRARSRLVAECTALINHLRALLLERGIVVAQGRRKLENALSVFADENDPRLSSRIRALVEDLRAEWRGLDERIAAFDTEFVHMAREDEAARRLSTIPGIGVINATALTAAIGECGQLRARSRSCRLAGADAATGDDGRKAKAAGNLETGQPLPANEPDPRRASGPAAHPGPGYAAGQVGAWPVGTDTQECRGGCAGRQTRAHRLGGAAQGARLRSGDRSGIGIGDHQPPS